MTCTTYIFKYLFPIIQTFEEVISEDPTNVVLTSHKRESFQAFSWTLPQNH